MEESRSEEIVDGRLISKIDGYYEQVTKDDEGIAHIHRLYKHSEKVRPLTPVGVDLEAVMVQRAAPVIIRPSRRKRPTRSDEVTLAMGDAQIGFRGEETFHDERAMGLGLVAVRELQPDNIVLTGDMIDLPAMSRFSQRNDWQQSTQAALDRYHVYLAELRATSPNSKLVVVHGNHELRQPRYVQQNAAELMGIRRADMANELAVLTLQYLVRYDDLNVLSVDGYPNAAYWLEEDLKITHGTNAAKGGSNAAKYLQQEVTSTVYGHSHRLEVAYRTFPTRTGNRQIVAASPGCLCRIDGAVPGHRHSVDERDSLITRAENWQQGVLLIQHNPRNHHIQPMRIDEDGIQIFNEKFNA